MTVPVDWSTLNTALILSIGGYLWHQARKVDTIYQAMFGVNGRNGLLSRLGKVEGDSATVDKRIEETRHKLRNEYQATVLQLENGLNERLTRLEGRP